jgi:catechol 2,3-dioxygenase-like lactoylglutathione lyase family enzyme
VACRMTELVLDCRDPGKLARFWSEVLGYRIVHEGPDEVEIASPAPAAPSQGAPSPVTLLFLRSDDPKHDKLRLHIDVSATDRTQDEELARLLELGARHIDIGQGEQTWYVLADPEGHEFCLLRGTVQP